MKPQADHPAFPGLLQRRCWAGSSGLSSAHRAERYLESLRTLSPLWRIFDISGEFRLGQGQIDQVAQILEFTDTDRI